MNQGKRILLVVLAAATGASAVLGIMMLLSGGGSRDTGQVLLGTLTVVAGGLLAQACLTAIEKGLRIVPTAGLLSSLGGAVVILIGIVTQTDSRDFWRIASSLGCIAVLTAHASLLLAHRLPRKFVWAPGFTLVCTALLAQALLQQMWETSRPFRTHGEVYGVLMILAVGGTILVPVLRRISDQDARRAAATAGLPLCPHCGEPLPLSLRDEFPD